MRMRRLPPDGERTGQARGAYRHCFSWRGVPRSREPGRVFRYGISIPQPPTKNMPKKIPNRRMPSACPRRDFPLTSKSPFWFSRSIASRPPLRSKVLPKLGSASVSQRGHIHARYAGKEVTNRLGSRIGRQYDINVLEDLVE